MKIDLSVLFLCLPAFNAVSILKKEILAFTEMTKIVSFVVPSSHIQVN